MQTPIACSKKHMFQVAPMMHTYASNTYGKVTAKACTQLFTLNMNNLLRVNKFTLDSFKEHADKSDLVLSTQVTFTVKLRVAKACNNEN